MPKRAYTWGKSLEPKNHLRWKGNSSSKTCIFLGSMFIFRVYFQQFRWWKKIAGGVCGGCSSYCNGSSTLCHRLADAQLRMFFLSKFCQQCCRFLSFSIYIIWYIYTIHFIDLYRGFSWLPSVFCSLRNLLPKVLFFCFVWEKARFHETMSSSPWGAILKKMILRLSDVFVWLCEASQKAIESNLSPGNGQLCFPGRGAPGSKAARRATPPSWLRYIKIILRCFFNLQKHRLKCNTTKSNTKNTHEWIKHHQLICDPVSTSLFGTARRESCTTFVPLESPDSFWGYRSKGRRTFSRALENQNKTTALKA